MYKPLPDILASLHTQQMEELALISLSQEKKHKQDLYRSSIFFIEQSWQRIEPVFQGESFGLELGMSRPELTTYLQELQSRNPAFAWGWLRSRMNKKLLGIVTEVTPDLLEQFPKEAKLYTKSLRQCGQYWFRETPLHHLKAGYHTALGVACKWYGSYYERCTTQGVAPDLIFRAELRSFASFSMTMLHRTDGYLWDSAAASDLDAIIERGQPLLREQSIERIDPNTMPDKATRLGCPALRAKQIGTAQQSPFDGVVQWVEQVFQEYLQP